MAVSGFRLRARLGLSIPTSLPGPRGITPAFGYGAPHPSARGTSTLLSKTRCSAHTTGLSVTLWATHGYAFPLRVGSSPPRRASQAPRLIFPRALPPTTPEGPARACLLLPHRYQASSQSADWPPSYSYRGRIGFTSVAARVFAHAKFARSISPSRACWATCPNRQFTW